MNNNAVYLRIQLMRRFLSAAFSGRLGDEIDGIPVALFPKGKASYRCCTYRDRAISRYRLMALLGFGVEDEKDETRTLGSYAAEASARGAVPEGAALTVIDTACHACPSGRHTVTNLCRGCLARGCGEVCPRDAIRYECGTASIDTARCVNCGKCREACPYNAVVYTPLPCESNCPVGAISRGEGGAARIDFERCISCGRCSRACPFGAVAERSHLTEIAAALSGDDEKTRPTALIAPAAAGQFPGSFGQLISALRLAGFGGVVEVAWGAAATAEEESRELSERLREGKPLASSCCPAWTEAARLHCREMEPFVSSTPTPMAFSARLARTLRPASPTVFIGPCLAKKVEARRDGSADMVMTFEELAALFLAREIDVAECAESRPDNPGSERLPRLFARAGGVAAAVQERLRSSGENPELLQIDGLDRKALGRLRLMAQGKVRADFAEVMACPGGCICGPGTVADPRVGNRQLEQYAQEAREREASPA